MLNYIRDTLIVHDVDLLCGSHMLGQPDFSLPSPLFSLSPHDGDQAFHDGACRVGGCGLARDGRLRRPGQAAGYLLWWALLSL